MNAPHRLARLIGPLIVVALTALVGCGVLAAGRTDYPSAAETAPGRSLYREPIQEIVDDSLLTTDEKRQALRDLGIEDDKLIEALLTL